MLADTRLASVRALLTNQLLSNNDPILGHMQTWYRRSNGSIESDGPNWYVQCSIVSLNLCKEHLNMATFKIAFLLLIKSGTFSYIERLPTSSHTGVIHF